MADLKTDFTDTMDELQSELAANIEAMDLGTKVEAQSKWAAAQREFYREPDFSQ